MTLSAQNPLDLESATDLGFEKFINDFFWPTSSDAYDQVALENLDFLLLLHDEQEGENKELIKLTLRQLFLDFNYFASNLMDVEFSRKAGKEPLCGEGSKLYKSIINDNFMPAPPSMQIDAMPFKEKIKSFLRPIVKKPGIKNELQNLGGKLIFTNGLTKIIKAYCDESGLETPIVIPNYFFSKAPSPSYKERDVEALADKIAFCWRKILENKVEKISSNAIAYMKLIAFYYLSWAWRDMHKKDIFDLNDSLFITGTGGGYWNRMISYKVQKAGGKVVRLDHGGERPFCADKWWGINEFVFCDKFVTYSKAGAEAIKANINKAYKSLFDDPSQTEISSFKESSFNILRKKFDSSESPKEIKSIMFVPVGFQGEFNTTPSFTTHDVPYSEFQIQILRELQKTNIKVYYKQAPKAYLENIFKPEDFGAETVKGYLSECLEKADAFLFTFTGTAFCESLISDKPVLLIQAPPLRPMTDEQKEELSTACRLIKCGADKNNRLDLDSKKMLESIAPMSDEELRNRKLFRDKWLLN
jgi:hypothetical protein